MRITQLKAMKLVVAAGLCATCVLAHSTSFAITHANAIKMPLVQFYTECGEDEDTTNCGLGNTGTATTNRGGEWWFDRGTLEITDDGKVSVKIDDIMPRDISACPGGLSGVCRCAGTQGACGTPGNTCTGGVCMAAAGTKIEVEIWGQNFRKNNVLAASPCNSQSCIGRDYLGDCHGTFVFTVDANGDVDESTANGAFDCDGYLALDLGEFRAVQVRIDPVDGTGGPYSEEQLIAVPGFGE
jgi:hypothetical protein